MTTTRWTSPFAALLWKEWRQQRWLFVAMAVGPIAVATAVQCWSPVLFGGVALVVWLGFVVALSANVFAGEQDDGTARFLGSLAVARARVFLAKSGVVFVPQLLAGVAVVIVVDWFHGWRGARVVSLADLLSLEVAVVLACLAVAAVVASFGARALATFLLTGIVGAGVLAPASAAMYELHGRVGILPKLTRLTLVLDLGVLLAGAALLWCWRTDRAARRAGGLAALVASLLAVAAAPAVAVYVSAVVDIVLPDGSADARMVPRFLPDDSGVTRTTTTAITAETTTTGRARGATRRSTGVDGGRVRSIGVDVPRTAARRVRVRAPLR